MTSQQFILLTSDWSIGYKMWFEEFLVLGTTEIGKNLRGSARKNWLKRLSTNFFIEWIYRIGINK